MKRRRSKSTVPPLDERLVKLGLQDADPEDKQTQQILHLNELMQVRERISTPITSSRGTSPQARSSRAHSPHPDSFRPELTKLAKSLEASLSADLQKKNRERFAELERRYFFAKDALPADQCFSGISCVVMWHGRAYVMSPKGMTPQQALVTLNHFFPPGANASESEARDRLLAGLWYFRKSAEIVVTVPVSRGKPKARCASCGDIHFVSARSNDMKVLGCPKCGSRTHQPIDPSLAKPGSERRIRVTRVELCRRFRITSGRLRTIIDRYFPRKDEPQASRTAVTTEAPPSQ
jgi:hypothetical protein